MDDGDGGVAVHEEHRDGKSDEVGPADDDGVLALELYAAPVQQLDAPLRSAGDVEGDGGEIGPVDLGAADVGGGGAQAGGVERMETVDVLLGVDAGEDGVLVDVLGQGELDQYAVDGGIGVEVGNLARQRLHGNVRGVVESEGRDAAFLARLLLHSNVGLRIAPCADQDDGQAGNFAGAGLEFGDGILDLGADRLRNGLSVDIGSSHLEQFAIAIAKSTYVLLLGRCCKVELFGQTIGLKGSDCRRRDRDDADQQERGEGVGCNGCKRRCGRTSKPVSFD